MITSTDSPMSHRPVLLDPVLAAMAPRDDAVYLDGTFGAGGYSRALLQAADCRVIAIDRDPSAQTAANTLKDAFGDRFTFFEGRFSQLADIAADVAPKGLDGVVLDVGVSSMQLDQAERGFSFSKDGPLGMRMGDEGFSAADIVNHVSEGLLADILYRFGEERASRRIARAITTRRKTHPFETTLDLADVVAGCLPKPKPGRPGIHPATRSFQALRIAVNSELEELSTALHASQHSLKPGGVLAVVSFHSLEDRIVKRFLSTRSARASGGSRHEPQRQASEPVFTIPVSRGATPDEKEIDANPRARSARLRYGLRTDAASVPVTSAEADFGVTREMILADLAAAGFRLGRPR
ncbi:MAG: 16S rRNA (cytosine(1402)-N(4))-methyltransferase RsmH [Pseudomonadota bacterium]